MTDQEQVASLMSEFQGKDQTFAEFIAVLFKDKFVEFYLGDSYEDVSMEQISTSYPAVFCGKVIGAYKECLAVKAVHVNKNKQAELGGLLFINERAIRVLSEVTNDFAIQDMILRSNDVIPVYKAYLNKTSIKIKK